MDSTVLAALIGIAGTLVGGFGGVYYGNRLARETARTEREWTQQELERERQEVQRKLRSLLSFENQQNLDALSAFWTRITALDPGVAYSHAAQSYEERRAFVTLPMPEWGHFIWASNAARLADTLRDDHEVRDCYRLHANLDKLTALRHSLEEVRQRTQSVWAAIESVHVEIIGKGNPIPLEESPH